MTPFEPKGAVARWRVIYDLLLQAGVGDIISYADLGAQLGLDPGDDRHTIQMAVRRAAKEFLEQERRALEVETNVGYRVTEAQERSRLVRKQSVKVKRALTRTHDLAIHVDLTGLDMESRRLLEASAAVAYGQLQVTRALLHKQSRFNKALDSVSTQQETTAAELASMRERMAELEARIGERG